MVAAEYPDDADFEEGVINSVERSGKSWTITRDGWSLYCGDDCPIEPEVGQTVRIYPAGLGRAIRGLFINGVRFWYRTEAEEKEHWQIQFYGRDASDWLDRWDSGRSVWTIEMGGFGPGYEQCIHITAAEILRWLLANNPDFDDEEGWAELRTKISAEVTVLPVINALGLSGAQWGAAMNVAMQLYRRGPRELMADEAVKDRHIQVMRDFPQGRAA